MDNRAQSFGHGRHAHQSRRGALPVPDPDTNLAQHHPKQAELSRRRPKRPFEERENAYAQRASRIKSAMLSLPFDSRSLAALGGPSEFMANEEIMYWIESVLPLPNFWYSYCFEAAQNKQARGIAAKDYAQFAEDVLEASKMQHDSTSSGCPTRDLKTAMAGNKLDLVQQSASVACFIVRHGQRGGTFPEYDDPERLHRGSALLLATVFEELETGGGYFKKIFENYAANVASMKDLVREDSQAPEVPIKVERGSDIDERIVELNDEAGSVISTLEATLGGRDAVASKLTRSEERANQLEKLLADQQTKAAQQKESEIANLETEHNAAMERLIASRNEQVAKLQQENAELKAKLQQPGSAPQGVIQESDRVPVPELEETLAEVHAVV